ncbi:hypothetical protein Ddc_20454 [Ditylenchus destructor]|nr:hypothetical protein Ddc_20454 [Ditylenchus destructor]
MALALLVVLATTQLEDAHLVVLAMSHHGGLDAGASNQGGPDLEVRAVSDCQNLVDHDLLANFRSNLFYLDLFASSNLVLLATGFMTAYISALSTQEGEPPRAMRDRHPARRSSRRSPKKKHRNEMRSPRM